jgi:hypothetical protein
MLADDVDHRSTDLTQLACAHGRAVDARLGAPVGSNFARENRIVVACECDALLGEQRTQRGVRFDLQRHARAVGPAADHLRADAVTERKSERPEQHRLSRTRLATDDREPVGKRKRGVCDQAEIVDFQTSQSHPLTHLGV